MVLKVYKKEKSELLNKKKLLHLLNPVSDLNHGQIGQVNSISWLISQIIIYSFISKIN